MTGMIRSIRGVEVRLTDERWAHITEEHNELAGLRFEVLETIAQPARVLQGAQGALLAVREIDPGKWLVAVYREEADSGFVITAFLTRRRGWLDRRAQVWP
jgi:hypothetical protein